MAQQPQQQPQQQPFPKGAEGKALQQALFPGEQVIGWGQGRGGALLVATDQRALIIKVGALATGQPFGRKSSAWPYQHIISVDMQATFGSGWIEIVTAGTQAQRGSGAWSAWNKATVAVTADNMVAFLGSDAAWRPLVMVLRERIQQAQQAQQAPSVATAPQAATAPTIPDQIAALKHLLDVDAITQAEYDVKKAELLGRM